MPSKYIHKSAQRSRLKQQEKERSKEWKQERVKKRDEKLKVDVEEVITVDPFKVKEMKLWCREKVIAKEDGVTLRPLINRKIPQAP